MVPVDLSNAPTSCNLHGPTAIASPAPMETCNVDPLAACPMAPDMHALPEEGTADKALSVLKNDHLERVIQLRDKICARETDPERYELCVQMRDELLRESSEVQLLAAAYDHVMSTHCAKYKDRKLAREKRSTKRTKLDEDSEWNRFLDVAESGLEFKSQCLSPLKTVAACWGEDVVQHYQWVYKGPKYCKVLCTAARNVNTWKRAVEALNWLMLKRSQQGPSLKRRPIHDSSNPIQQGDLDNLAKYPPDTERAIEAPQGFGFDKFGLLVYEKYASVLPQADRLVSPSSATPPEVGNSDTSEEPSISDSTTSTGLETAAASEGSDRMSLDPIVREVINTVLAEGANEAMTSCGQSSSDSSEDRAAILPPPAPPDSANATPDSSITSEELDRTDSDTDGAGAEDGLGPANAVPDQSIRVAPRPRPSYQGLAGTKAAKPRQARLPRVQVTEMPPDCCSKVPSSLRLALTNPSLFDHEAAAQLFPFLGQLCREHLQRYAELRHHTEQPLAMALAKGAGLLEHLNTPSKAALYADASTSFRRRRASLSDITTPSKRPRLDAPLALSKWPGIRGDRPAQDIIADDAYRRRVMAELRQVTPVAGSHGEETNRLVYELLERVQHPNTDSCRGRVEAWFCTGDEAAHMVESRSPVDAPIFTKDQQPFRWGEGGRPVEQFFRRTSRLAVLTRSPFRVLMAGSAERVVASTEQWSEWKDVDKWALLSQGGHHTAPHMDSHGYSTWITAQEGTIGFIWMSSPTKEEREAWMANPHCYTGGRWRYVLIRPGETVFFGPGTIHGVFREQNCQTLAFGGHVLQWSGIQRWIQVVLAELNNPATTNEEMKTTAPKLVGVVATLVETKVKEGRVEELGGEAAVKGFFESVREVRRKQNWKNFN
ncbi:uncharacterized protein B0H64DRAFT_436431 [Chaetomium fimeti]|uniref:JmjC domain-containing protein n=1 Tax=Chaetomium fimeti TaxID=1854472 RepID=A0AAE0H737_9PEZI|nr:hypothetical protein B0H64DRAFT_436947 [Chaetomium fimeti]KAK3291071.1 hypothetical protein B0H64DRAFT_436431 [Chaetomium fimeti]